jgi:hypothetical protein
VVLCSDGEDELYYKILLEEEAGHKLQVTSSAAVLADAIISLRLALAGKA